MKKTVILLTVLMSLTTLGLQAGVWKIHGTFVGTSTKNVVDAGDRVYYLNSNNLYYLDKNTLESQILDKTTGLSDMNVVGIYYDYDRNLLFAAYDNSNIDIIDAQGTVTNVSSIKDLPATSGNVVINADDPDDKYVESYSGKVIKDITFSNGKAYVAGEFGYMVIDETTLATTASLMTTDIIYSMTKVGDYTVLLTDSAFCYATGDVHISLDEFGRQAGTYANASLYPVSDSTFFLNATGALSLCRMAVSDSTAYTATTKVSVKADNLQRYPTGFLANFMASSYYYTFDVTGTTGTKVTTSKEMASCHPAGDGIVWLLGANGIHQRGSTVYYKANGSSVADPYWMSYNRVAHRLYVAATGTINGTGLPVGGNSMATSTYDGSTWRTATPVTKTGGTIPTGGYAFTFHPTRPNVYFRGGWSASNTTTTNPYGWAMKIINDTVQQNYHSSNSYIVTQYHPNLAFDIYGNLWHASSMSNSAACPLCVLPANKVDTLATAKSDWYPIVYTPFTTRSIKFSHFLIDSLTNIKVYTDGGLSNGTTGQLFFWSNFSQEVNPEIAPYTFKSFDRFKDQDSKEVSWTYLRCLTQDHAGRVWVGHLGGIFYLYPEMAFGDTVMVHRPAHNEGGVKSGILLDGIEVRQISVDNNDNKWVATMGNGLYCLNPDGTQVLQHFTSSNSQLPSNTVFAVACDVDHNSVFAITTYGIVEYFPDMIPTASDFSQVAVVPDLVEPGFTGMVKISGLMQATYVTITDVDGNVVKTMGPVDGYALWDMCGDNDEKVDTGTYRVYVSQNAGELPAQPVTTVNIVK